MIKVGLCGKIAAGKSEVEKIFENKGFLVLDLDKVSHKLLLEDEDVKNKILKEFQTLDRKELAKIVFADNSKRERLEKIIHPVLKEEIFQFFEANKNEDVLFVSGALLYQAGFDCLFDKIIFVDAEQNIRLKRLMQRNSLSQKEAMKRMASQEGNFEFQADFIIKNNSDFFDLKKEVEKVIKELN